MGWAYDTFIGRESDCASNAKCPSWEDGNELFYAGLGMNLVTLYRYLDFLFFLLIVDCPDVFLTSSGVSGEALWMYKMEFIAHHLVCKEAFFQHIISKLSNEEGKFFRENRDIARN